MRALFAAALVAAVLAAPAARGDHLPPISLYVNDFVGALFLSEIEDIEALCVEVDVETSAEIAVVLVNTTQPLGIDTYAVELFEEAGIGKQGLDNGVLVLVATGEDAWRIEVGYGLEGILPDSRVGKVGMDYLEPNVTGGYTYDGIYEAVYALRTILVNEYEPPENRPPTRDLWQIDWAWICGPAVLAVVLAVLTKGRFAPFLGRVVFRKGGFGGGRSGGGGASGKG